MERDQLLEGATLVALGVIKAAHGYVRGVREAIGAQEVPRGGRREGRERILAIDLSGRQVERARAPERHRPELGRVDEQPTDVRVLAQRRDEPRMATLDLLERHPALLLHEVDQAEVSRPQDHHLAAGDVVLGALGRLGAGRLIQGVPRHRSLLVTTGEAGHLASGK